MIRIIRRKYMTSFSSRTNLNPIAAAASTQRQQQHGHSHSCGHDHSHNHSEESAHGHSHNHGHSHGTIEANVAGEALRQCKIVTGVGAATNVFFAITKVYLGNVGGSIALTADGFHALTDIFADAVSYLSITFAAASLPRCRFPFGIGRLETIGAVVVAAILLGGGIMLLMQSFLECIALIAPVSLGGYVVSSSNSSSSHSNDDAHGHTHDHDHDHEEAEEQQHGHTHGHHGHSHFELTGIDMSGKQVILWTMVVLAGASVVCKELLFHWTKRVGERAGSRVVVANAYHHRADAWSGAVALVGVVGQYFGIPGVDGIAGMLVSLSICKIGYSLMKGSVLEFFDYQNSGDIYQVRKKLQMYSPIVESEKIVQSTSTEAIKNIIEVHKIVPINVFLMRHGTSYALHVTLLANEVHTAAQIAVASEKLTKLAQSDMSVEDTYVKVLVSSPETVPRKEYEQLLVKQGQKVAKENEKEEENETYALPDKILASGAVVNPSLERCLFAVINFHHFHFDVTYNWEKREVNIPNIHLSSECKRDVEALANCFKCTVHLEQ